MESMQFLWIIPCIIYCYGYEAEIVSTNSVLYSQTGKSLNVTCKMNATRQLNTIYFIKNGVNFGSVFVLDNFCHPAELFTCDHDKNTFTILNPGTIIDGDKWSCREENGEVSKNVSIFVVEPFSLITMTLPSEEQTTIDENLVGVFECQTSLSRPEAQIRWYKRLVNGTDILFQFDFSNDILKNTSKTWTKSRLNYTGQKGDNGASIFCVGFLSHLVTAIHNESRKIQLNIRYPPAQKPLTDNNGSITVAETSNIEISCHISGGNPIASLSWECNGDNVSGSIEQNDTMFLSKLSLPAKSKYNKKSCYCIASHPLLTEEERVQTVLNILFSPMQNVTVTSNDVEYFNASSNVTLHCVVYSGNPVADAVWTCDGINVISVVKDLGDRVQSTTSFQVEKKDNRRRCICTANHFLWTKPIHEQLILNVYFSPDTDLTITGNSSLNILYENDTVDLSCTLSNGNPLAKLTFNCWSPEAGLDTSNSTTAISIIRTIAQRSFTDKKCTCTAEHILLPKTLVKEIQTTVYYPPSKPQLRFLPKQPLLEGREVEVTCNADEGYPYISSFDWYLDGQSTLNKNKTLKFINMTKENNQKSINCRVNNAFTDQKELVIVSSVVTLNVHYRPLIRKFDKDMITNEGMTINQSCLATGNPVPYVQWFYRNGPVSTNNTKESNLNLAEIKRSKQGDYNCKAIAYSESYGALESISTIKITVNYPPDVSVLVEGNNMSLGSSVILLCNAAGQPDKYTFRGWRHTFHGLEIRNTEEMQSMGNGSFLNITKLSYQDFGTYSCFVDNGIQIGNGSLTQTNSVYIAVKGFPIKIPENPTYPTFTTEQHSPLIAMLRFYTFPNITDIKWYNLTTGSAISPTGFSSNISKTILKYTLYGHTVDFRDFAYDALFMIEDFQYYQEGIYSMVVSNEDRMSNFTFRAQISGPPESPLYVNVSEKTDSSITLLLISGFNGGHEQYFHVLYHELYHEAVIYDRSFTDKNIKPQLLKIISLLPSTFYKLSVYSSNEKGNSTLNETTCCRHVIVQTDDKTEVRAKNQELQLAGLAAGLASAVFAVIVVIAIVIFLRRRLPSFKKGKEENGRLNLTSNATEDEGDNGLKDNILYESAGSDFDRKTLSSGPEYAMVYKTGDRFKPAENQKTLQETGIYSEVKKKPKVKTAADVYVNASGAKNEKGKNRNKRMKDGIAIEDVYENMPDELKVKSNDNSVKTNTNRDGLQYAELVFNPSSNGSKFVIHGIEDRTIYAVVDTTQNIDPLPDSDAEEDAQSLPADKQDE